jgi:hypothetical protein
MCNRRYIYTYISHGTTIPYTMEIHHFIHTHTHIHTFRIEPLNHWTTEPLNHWTTELLNHWTTEPLNHYIACIAYSVGFEPTTYGLEGNCSTYWARNTEMCWQGVAYIELELDVRCEMWDERCEMWDVRWEMCNASNGLSSIYYILYLE